MQETQVQSLVQEDPTCHAATKPVCRNYWNPHTLGPMLHRRSHCNEKFVNCSWRVAPALCNLRKVREAMKTQRSQKYIDKSNYEKKFKRLVVPLTEMADSGQECMSFISVAFDFNDYPSVKPCLFLGFQFLECFCSLEREIFLLLYNFLMLIFFFF